MERAQILRIAMRYDTAMSRAMLRALGVDVPEMRLKPGTVIRADRYSGMMECFENRRRVRL